MEEAGDEVVVRVVVRVLVEVASLEAGTMNESSLDEGESLAVAFVVVVVVVAEVFIPAVDVERDAIDLVTLLVEVAVATLGIVAIRVVILMSLN